jgi:tetratricopeptide (TPR) repeat protein
MKKLSKKSEQLLDRLDRAETEEEIREVGKLLLEEDPASPYGKLAVWQTLSDEDCISRLDVLREALEEMRALIDAHSEPPIVETDRDAQVYCNILMNLGYALHATGDSEGALAIARELADFDDEGFFPSRTLLYRSMLDLGLYKEILETLGKDDIESVLGEHARAIALLETGADKKTVREAVDYAITIAPDVPFYVLGIWEVPDGDDVDEAVEDDIHYASFLAEPWSASDERLVELSAPAFMLGYVTHRLEDEKETATLREGYKNAGILDKVEALKAKLTDMEGEGRDPAEIDTAAMGEIEELLELLWG